MGIRSNKVLDQINVKESFEKKKGPSSPVPVPVESGDLRTVRNDILFSFISVTARTASLNLNHWHGHGNSLSTPEKLKFNKKS